MTELFKEHCSDFLFARPSLIGGVSRLLDFAGTLKTYNYSESLEMADLLAMSQDWKAVGIVLREALEKYRTQINK